MRHFTVDDGGRSAAGFTGDTGDCAVRAIAIATRKPYAVVYAAINELAKSERTGKRKRSVSNARTGVYVQTVHKLMADYGWQWVPTMAIGKGCTVHLVASELPAGRIVVRVSKHYTAMVDGVIHDTFDPSADRRVTIYPPTTPADRLPKGAHLLDNGNGWSYAPRRCVYGYWRANA